MIWESIYWKNDLIKISQRLEKVLTKKSIRESSYIKIEKDIMMGFFIVRKLIDSHKISDEVLIQQIPTIECHQVKDTVIDVMSLNSFHHRYDFKMQVKGSLNIRKLCNFVIHSLVFAPVTISGKGLTGILVNTDESQSKIFAISLMNVVTIFKNVSSDELRITVFTRSADQSGKRMKGKFSRKLRKDDIPLEKYKRVEIFN